MNNKEEYQERVGGPEMEYLQYLMENPEINDRPKEEGES